MANSWDLEGVAKSVTGSRTRGNDLLGDGSGAGGTGSGCAPVGLHALTQIVGRDAEFRALRGQVLDPAVRLLTVTGPVGVGKTRLALAVCQEVRPRFPAGCLLLDLSRVTDPRALPAAIACALGHVEEGAVSLESLAERLHDQELLLVVDHGEHLGDSLGSAVSALLSACPRLQALVASREPLSVYGERLFTVPPLEVPGPNPPRDPADVERIASVELFLRRVADVRPDFKLVAGDHVTVAELCDRLDGLPLAIELAAARMKLFQPHALLARLRSGRDVLHGGRADTLSRHSSLSDAIAPSYERLEPTEQRLLLWLSVFCAGFGVDAAAALFGEKVDAVHERLEVLVSRNLLTLAVQSDGEPRLSMLHTVRSFAYDRLRRSGELEMVSRRHAEHFLGVAEAASVGLIGSTQRRWAAQLRLDDGNLDAAFRWFLQHEQDERAAAMAAALTPYWFVSGRLRTGAAWLEEALAGCDHANAVTPEAFLAAGQIATALGDYDVADERLRLAHNLCGTRGDRYGMALCLHHLGRLAYLRGDLVSARQMLIEGVQGISEHPSRSRAHPWELSSVLSDLAVLHLAEGDLAEARGLVDSALQGFRQLGDAKAEAMMRCNYAAIAAAGGDVATAEQAYRQALRTLHELGDHMGVTLCLEGLVALIGTDGRHGRQCWRRVVRLVAAARRLREDIGHRADPRWEAVLTGVVTRARAQFGSELVDREQAEGTALPTARVVEEALGPLPREIPDVEAAARAKPLTPREHEVAELVERGLTNRQIARQLGIAEWTAVNHVRNVMRKLDCSSRVHVARLMARARLPGTGGGSADPES